MLTLVLRSSSTSNAGWHSLNRCSSPVAAIRNKNTTADLVWMNCPLRMDALKSGIANLEKHIENVQRFAYLLVALNCFTTDTDAEIEYVKQFCLERL